MHNWRYQRLRRVSRCQHQRGNCWQWSRSSTVQSCYGYTRLSHSSPQPQKSQTSTASNTCTPLSEQSLSFDPTKPLINNLNTTHHNNYTYVEKKTKQTYFLNLLQYKTFNHIKMQYNLKFKKENIILSFIIPIIIIMYKNRTNWKDTYHTAWTVNVKLHGKWEQGDTEGADFRLDCGKVACLSSENLWSFVIREKWECYSVTNLARCL